MWEAISNIITSSNGIQTLCILMFVFIIITVMVKIGVIHIKTNHVRIGVSDKERERTILREQLDWVDTYLQGLESKIRATAPELQYGGYLAKHILDLVYKEIAKWITFNHITNNDAYVHTKTQKLISLVYAQKVQDVFTTPEFNTRMERWVKEIIEQLVEIRRLYEK